MAHRIPKSTRLARLVAVEIDMDTLDSISEIAELCEIFTYEEYFLAALEYFHKHALEELAGGHLAVVDPRDKQFYTFDNGPMAKIRRKVQEGVVV